MRKSVARLQFFLYILINYCSSTSPACSNVDKEQMVFLGLLNFFYIYQII